MILENTLQQQNKKYPVSYAQESFFLLDRMSPNKEAYNIPLKLIIRGEFHIPIFEHGLKILIARHEVFRTSFYQKDGKFWQKVDDNVDFNITITKTARESMELSEKCCTMDLSKAPLMKCYALCFSDQYYEIYFEFHHIIMDVCSLAIFLKELQDSYFALYNNQQPEFDKMRFQYSDFSKWQRQHAFTEGLRYWLNQFATQHELLALPSDKSRQAKASNLAASFKFTVDCQLFSSLVNIANKHRVSLSIILLAIFQLLLFRYTQQHDIVVGLPVANRQDIHFLNIIGPMLNTLMIRQCINADISFSSLLKSTRNTVLDALVYQDVPYIKLTQELSSLQKNNYSSLFNVFFNYIETGHLTMQLPNADVNLVEIEQKFSKFDLSLHVRKYTDSLQCNFEYTVELFDAKTISKMAEHFKILMGEAVQDTEVAIGQLRMLTDQELIELLG